jgi:hypothetical protein
MPILGECLRRLWPGGEHPSLATPQYCSEGAEIGDLGWRLFVTDFHADSRPSFGPEPFCLGFNF